MGVYRKWGILKVDNRDYQMIDQLIENPRSTLSCIAKKLGISVTATSNRLKKLEKNSIIKFEVSLNLEKFQMTHAFMFIETTDAGSRKDVIDRFSNCPLVDKIFDLIGSEYHLAVLLISPDSNLLSNFMTYCPIRYIDGIKKINAYYSLLENNSPIFLPISFKKNSANSTCGTDCNKDCSRYKIQCPGCPALDYKVENKEALLATV